MKTIGFNRKECIDNLQTYIDEIEDILSLLEDNLPLSGADKEKAQELMKNLKAALKTENERRDRVRRQEQMSEVERAFLYPAIHEAKVRISVKWNSIPGQNWIDDLYEAQDNIDYFLSQLLAQKD